MIKFLLKFFNHRKNDPFENIVPINLILNVGLAFAMEFGTNWLQPIQDRLRIIYPHLTEPELDNFNALCKKAMSYGHELIYTMAEKSGQDLNQVEAINKIKSTYPWIDDKNINHLISQSIYYAFKDGIF